VTQEKTLKWVDNYRDRRFHRRCVGFLRAVLTVASVPGGDTASPSQAGLLLLYRDAASNHEAQAIRLGGDNGGHP
jgi:hypothetical protein